MSERNIEGMENQKTLTKNKTHTKDMAKKAKLKPIQKILK